MTYNGHRSWNAWNIALWINNDESLYHDAKELVKNHGRRKAARILSGRWSRKRTPDGANFNYTCIYEALDGINE